MNTEARIAALEADVAALKAQDAAPALIADGLHPKDFPGYAETLALLVAEGCPALGPGANAPMQIMIGLYRGMSPALIAEHYTKITKNHFGGNWQAARGHGANWMLSTRSADLLAGIGIGEPAWSSDETPITEPLPSRPSRGTEYAGTWDGKEPQE